MITFSLLTISACIELSCFLFFCPDQKISKLILSKMMMDIKFCSSVSSANCQVDIYLLKIDENLGQKSAKNGNKVRTNSGFSWQVYQSMVYFESNFCTSFREQAQNDLNQSLFLPRQSSTSIPIPCAHTQKKTAQQTTKQFIMLNMFVVGGTCASTVQAVLISS